MNIPHETLQPAAPAATLVVFDDQDAGPPKLLFVERASTMAFAAGAIVFPGGRVDPDDHLIAARYDHVDPDCAAARVAAIRETLEETGLPIGIVEEVAEGWVEAARTALHAATPFSKILEDANLTLDIETLIPFARWRPNFKEARIFDTRFYIVGAPSPLPRTSVDATENARMFWDTAQGVIDAADRGEARIIFPTHRNLERLALFERYTDAEAHALETPVRMVTPWIEGEGDDQYLCIPDDLGYPVTRQSLRTAKRAGR
jgi:8-oxo-dGTP pyrophosphatase MutT (NUDIX family)